MVNYNVVNFTSLVTKPCSLHCSGMNFSVIQSVLLLVLKALWNIGWVGGTSKMTCDGKET